MGLQAVNPLERYMLRIVPLTPLRIGAGVEGNVQRILTSFIVKEAELAIEETSVFTTNAISKRTPVIPASSIKGLLRALAEQLSSRLYSRSMKPQSVSDIPKLLAAYHHHTTPSEDTARESIRQKGCNISSLPLIHYTPTLSDKCGDETLGEIVGEVKNVIGDYSNCIERVPPSTSIDWAFEAFASRYCPICILFGSQFQAGALRITDALPVDNVLSNYRTHVSIDRRTLTKEEAKLYVEEYIEPGVTFVARINLLWPLTTLNEDSNNICKQLYNHALTEAKKLLSVLIEYVNSTPIEIGGSKSRGLGLVKLNITKV
jgi:CRISPR/Cas system CSM-associated protein Csm3 (group 7 of RAMP superfamily)